MFTFLIYFTISGLTGSLFNSGIPYKKTLFVEGFRTTKVVESVSDENIINEIINDPDNIINDIFKVPSGIKARVLFWANIYGTHPSSSFVIHNRDRLDQVYEVVDLSNVFTDKKLNSVQKELKANSILAERKESVAVKYKKNINDIRVQTGQKDKILKGLQDSYAYLAIIEEIFMEQGLPWELTRIPFVESSFNIRAQSKVGAKGIWQIMSNTGSGFMNIAPYYDERYSPFKASAVASYLLKENYSILKSWPLAITAYNHGPGGLRKAVRELKTTDICKIVNSYRGKNFGFASKNFYAEFLAALYVTVYYERIFGRIEKKEPMNIYYINIAEDTYIDELIDISGLTKESLLVYNPEFGRDIKEAKIPIKKGSKIKLPTRASYRVEDHFIRMLDYNEDIYSPAS